MQNEIALDLKRFVKTHIARHRDLVRRDAAFEEIGEFLDVLEIHKGERVFDSVDLLETEIDGRRRRR